MTPSTVFISYSHADNAAACRLARGLAAAHIPVWMDKQRLELGENYENRLEQAVKDCSFFIALISKATESDGSRYVHKERAWAASRHGGNCVFYLPVVIDGTTSWNLEPDCYKEIHRIQLPQGETNTEFIERMHKLLNEYRRSERPMR